MQRPGMRGSSRQGLLGRATMVLAFGMTCGLAACSKGEATTERTSATAETTPTKKTVDPATVGVVTGTVSFAGVVPDATRIRASGDAACAQAHPGEFSAEDVKVKDGRVEDAFVWIQSGLEGYTFAPPAGPVRLDQRGCMYNPRFAVAWVGQELEFTNSDPTLHNVAAKPVSQRGWNFVTPQGQSGRQTFRKAEVPVKVGCDVHPWMRAYVAVVDNPFIARTGSQGTFRLEGLPPGTYTLRAWHERLGRAEKKIVIGPKETKAVALALPGALAGE